MSSDDRAASHRTRLALPFATLFPALIAGALLVDLLLHRFQLPWLLGWQETLAFVSLAVVMANVSGSICGRFFA